MRSLVYEENFQNRIFQSSELTLDDSRQNSRHRIRENATIDSPISGCLPVEVIDISPYGCCLFGPSGIVKNQSILVRIRDFPAIEGSVRWARKRTLGIEFRQALEPAALASIRHRLIAG
jgi:hypothetical protein